MLQTAQRLTQFILPKTTERSLNRSVSYSTHKQKREPNVNPAAPPMHQQKSVMKSVVMSPTLDHSNLHVALCRNNLGPEPQYKRHSHQQTNRNNIHLTQFNNELANQVTITCPRFMPESVIEEEVTPQASCCQRSQRLNKFATRSSGFSIKF